MPGRRPKPTALKILEGNLGKRPLNQNEPQIPDGVLECPEHLTGEARTEWLRIAPVLTESRILTVADRAALSAYCQTWARMVEAEIKIKEKGLLIETKDGNLIQNPYVGIANTAAKLMRGYLSELGLTPSSRSKVQKTSGNSSGGEKEKDKKRFFQGPRLAAS